jgi:hypothetical protein
MPFLSPHVNAFSKNAILTFQTSVFDYRSGQMGTANNKNRVFKNAYAALQGGMIVVLRPLIAAALVVRRRYFVAAPRLFPRPRSLCVAGA